MTNKESPRGTLSRSQGLTKRNTHRAKLKVLSLLAGFKVGYNPQPEPLPPDTITSLAHSTGDGFNHLAFHHFSHRYIKRLEAHQYSAGYIKNSRAVLLDYSRFLEAQAIDLIQNTDRQTWRNYTNNLASKGLSKSTVGRNQSVLRMFYRFLTSEDILHSNPFKGLSSPKLDKRLPQFLTTKEAKRLVESPDLSTPKGHLHRAILEFLYATGVRASELVNLDISHINSDRQEALVCGKGDKERLVLFGKPAARALATYLNEARPKLLNGSTTRAVFIMPLGRRIYREYLTRMVRLYGQQVLNKRAYPHLFRHTFATHLLDGGADIRVVQELLGHVSLLTTAIYTHTSISHIRKAYMLAHPLAQGDNHNLKGEMEND